MINKFAPKKIYERICSICEKPFKTNYIKQNVCDFECSMIYRREQSRITKERKRNSFLRRILPTLKKDTPKIGCVICEEKGYENCIFVTDEKHYCHYKWAQAIDRGELEEKEHA